MSRNNKLTLFTKNGKTKIKQKVDTNKLTKYIKGLMNMNGFEMWRNNNHGVYDKNIVYKDKKSGALVKGAFRKNSVDMLGVPDLIGIHKKTGIFVGVECKNQDDLSPEQELFIEMITRNNGLCFSARGSTLNFQKSLDNALKGHKYEKEIRAGIKIKL